MMIVRLVLACLLLSLTPASAYFFSPGGGSPALPGNVVASRTIYNSAASSTPTGSGQTCLSSGSTCFPFLMFEEFAKDAVPTGQIAVPTVASAAVRYQADECLYWNDGSLLGCQFRLFVPQLSATSTEDVVFTTQSGSYNNTSSGAISDITSNTDYKIHIAGDQQVSLNEAWTTPTGQLVPPTTEFGFYVTSGSLSGVYLRHRIGFDNQTISGTTSPITVQNCTGTTPTYTVTAGGDGFADTPVITNAGSGCPSNATGLSSGNGTCDFNTNATAGAGTTAVYRVTSGALVDTWDVWGPFLDDTASTPDTWLHCHIIVERWKNADGSTYAYRAIGMVTNGLYIHDGQMPPNTYDADWCNGTCPGAGEIRGNGDGSTTTWTRIYQYANTGWITTGVTGQPDWTVNDVGLKAVVSSFSTAEKLALRATRLIEPFDNTVTPTVKTISVNNYQTPIGSAIGADEGQYYPLCFCMTDTAVDWTQGGSHSFLGGLSNNAIDYLLAVDVASDKGLSLLQSNRLAVIGVWGMNAGAVEPATGMPVNQISTSTFPSLTPLRTGYNLFSLPFTPCPPEAGFDMCWLTNGSNPTGHAFYNGGSVDPYTHYPGGGSYRLDYLIEGEPWVEDVMAMDASQIMPTSRHNALVLGSTTYPFSPWVGRPGTRAPAWASYTLEDAARFLPSSRPQQSYYEYLQQSSYTTEKAWESWVGTFDDNDSASGTKTYDLTPAGIFEPYTSYATTNIGGFYNLSVVIWQDEYMLFSTLTSYNDWGGATGKYPDIISWATTFAENYFAQDYSGPCPYNDINYVLPGGYMQSGKPLSGWCSDITCTPITRFNEPTFSGVSADTFNGSQEIAASTWNYQNSGGEAGSLQLNTTAATAAGGNVLTFSSTSAVLVPSVIRDCGTSCTTSADAGTIPEPTIVVSKTPTTVTLNNNVTGAGILNGDRIIFSGQWDYPMNSGTFWPALSRVQPVALDVLDEVVPGYGFRTPYPPTPWPNEQTPYWFCPDATYPLVMGTVSTTAACPGTPLTFTSSSSFGLGIVANASCPANSFGSWNGGGDSADGRFAASLAAGNWILATFGDTTGNLASSMTKFKAIAGYPTVMEPYPLFALGPTY